MKPRTLRIILRIAASVGGISSLGTPLLVVVIGFLIAVIASAGGGYNTALTLAATPPGYQCNTNATGEASGTSESADATTTVSNDTASATQTTTPTPVPNTPAATAMPYPLPASHGTAGTEEAVDAAGRVRSTGGAVTWSKFAALGQPYRDFYITMRWSYAAWNWDGTATNIDNDQFQWFAAQPRLVLVTNPRTGASIIAAAIEAGPAPWVGITSSSNRAKSQGPTFGWTNPIRGTPAGWTGIVSGFPPTALTTLGARTGYPGQTGDDLVYQWAPDQNATPGPTGLTATAQPGTGCIPVTLCTNTNNNTSTANTTPPADPTTASDNSAPPTANNCPPGGGVIVNGVAVTVPAAVGVPTAAIGRTVTAPNAAAAHGLAAGFAMLGLPYVWGGGTDGGGPDEGCNRGGGSKNSCQGIVGFDCSGLTGYVLAQTGHTIPSNSGTQRISGTAIPRSQALPGDIIGYPGHVAIYLGFINGVEYMLEAPDVGLTVRIRTARWNGADTNLRRYWS